MTTSAYTVPVSNFHHELGRYHFAHAHTPANVSVVAQYGDLPRRAGSMGGRLEAIDAAHGGALDVSAVGDAVRRALDMPHGERPARIVVDAQQKGVEELNALHRAKQAPFFRELGIEDLMVIPQGKR